MKASVNFKFSSFAPRHRLSELISTLGLASVATATRYDSVACDERNFSSSEERALAPLDLSSQPLGRWPKGKAKESLAEGVYTNLKPLAVASFNIQHSTLTL